LLYFQTPLAGRYSSPRSSSSSLRQAVTATNHTTSPLSHAHPAGLPPHHPHPHNHHHHTHEPVTYRKSSEYSALDHSGNNSAANTPPGHSSTNSRRFSKTLPRGFSLSAATAECGAGDSVYGLYGDLLNVADYDSETGYCGQSAACGGQPGALASCHKSDPELNTIPYRVSTLDRRMTMKLARPRSLDLSSWSVESRSSSHTSSDGSDRSAPSPSVSRNASFMSHKSVGGASITMNGACGGGGEGLSRASSMRKPAGSAVSGGNNNAAAKQKLEGARTVTTIMGGRGYHRWHPIKRLATNLAKMNDTDACLVAWEQKT
jgi:Rho guanine nucleotide exchange factor 10